MLVVTNLELQLLNDDMSDLFTLKYSNNTKFKTVYIVDGSSGKFNKIIDIN